MIGQGSTESLWKIHQRLLEGDAEALSELFSLFHDRLVRLIAFRLHSRLAGRLGTDDVLQEAFLAATRRLPAYRSGEFIPYVWIRAVVLQTLTDLHRYHLGTQCRASGREETTQWLAASSESIASALISRWISPSQAVERAEMYELVERTVRELEEMDQEILALRHFEELSNQEAAEVLGIQPKAASIRYVRALARLRTALAQFPGFFE